MSTRNSTLLSKVMFEVRVEKQKTKMSNFLQKQNYAFFLMGRMVMVMVLRDGWEKKRGVEMGLPFRCKKKKPAHVSFSTVASLSVYVFFYIFFGVPKVPILTDP